MIKPQGQHFICRQNQQIQMFLKVPNGCRQFNQRKTEKKHAGCMYQVTPRALCSCSEDSLHERCTTNFSVSTFSSCRPQKKEKEGRCVPASRPRNILFGGAGGRLIRLQRRPQRQGQRRCDSDRFCWASRRGLKKISTSLNSTNF